MLIPSVRALLALWVLQVPVRAFDCVFQVESASYDLSALAGLRTATKENQTPPTTSEAKVALDLCGGSGIPKEDGVPDEDQCGDNTRVCLKLLNHKASAAEPDRVTAVIPIWATDSSDPQLTPLGEDGDHGIMIVVQGPDYAGAQQTLNLSLLCDPSAKNSEPSLVSYGSNVLTLSWATPDACPWSEDGTQPDVPSSGGGSGFFGFLKLLFWLAIVGLVLYFAIGIFYNHQQYSSRGWDLVPHRDFWREFPVLVQDLFSHVLAGLRGGGGGGGGGRGGYSSLG